MIDAPEMIAENSMIPIIKARREEADETEEKNSVSLFFSYGFIEGELL